MIGALIDTIADTSWQRAARGTGFRGMLGAVRTAYRVHAAENRAERDVAAIAAALSRLSPQRLALIGMRRDRLLGDVETLMTRAREARSEVQEILALVDRTHVGRPSEDATDRPDDHAMPLREVLSSRQAA